MLSDYLAQNLFLKNLLEEEEVQSFVVATFDSKKIHFNPAAQGLFNLESAIHEIKTLESKECNLLDQFIEILQSLNNNSDAQPHFKTTEIKGDGYNLRVKYKVDRQLIQNEEKVFLFFIEKIPSLPHELARLERVNQELKDYAHILSHDLRAPLRGIHSLAEWIKEDNTELSVESQQHLNLLLERADYMDQLIDGVLAYSKLEAFDQREKVDFNDLVELVINSVDKPQNANIQVISSLPELFVNRTHMIQLFQNLISNAIKYNDKEQIEISVSSKDIGRFFQFEVADNGKGIADRYFGKIFDKFENLDDKMKSSGLGLSIVRKIVHLCGGAIWLESEIGIGSKFHFTLAKSIQT